MMEETIGKEKILVYGEAGNGESLEYILKGNGYAVCRAETAEKLCEGFAQEDISLLMFFMREDETKAAEELALLKKLRQESRKPILVSVGGGSEMLRIMALNAGADDCVGKECSVLESLARVQAQLRCYRRLLTEKKPDRLIRMDGIEVDDVAKMVWVEGNRVDLTPTEYKILRLLMEKPGRVLSNSQIYESIWKMAPIGADNTVAVHIRHIREKIEENPQNPRYLRVVWGQGYKVG